MSVPVLTEYTQILPTTRVLYNRGGVNPVHPLAYGPISGGSAPSEYGWVLEMRNTHDGTGATSIVFEFMAPSGTTSTKTATAVGGDHTSEDYQWTVTTGMFDTPGGWNVRMIFSLPTTPNSQLRTRWVPFRIGGGF